MTSGLAIVERELLSLLRTRRALLVLLGVAIGVGGIVLLKWPTTGLVDLSGARSQVVFQGLAGATLIAALLIAPVFPATSLVREVQGATLELLLNSPMSSRTLFLGKVAAMIGFTILLLFAALPAMACCYAMGGISFTGDVLVLGGFLLVVCLELTVLGLLVGTYCRTPESALRWAYAVTFLLTVVPIIPDLFLRGGTSIATDAAEWLKVASPIPALLQLIGQESRGGTGLADTRNLLLWYLLSAAIVIVWASLACVRRLDYSLLDRSRSQGLITDERSLRVRAARRVFYLIDPQRRSIGIPFFLNPVMVKEFRSRQFGRLHWLLRLIAGCAVLSLLLTLGTTAGTIDWGVEIIGGIIIVLQAGLIMILTPGLAGGMIAGELESGGWDLLRVTPLRPSRILSGKLTSVCLTLALVLCATLPGYWIITVIKPVLREQVNQVIISLVIAAALSMLLAATTSSFFRTTAMATTVSYGLMISLYAGTLLVWLNRDAPFSHSAVQVALTLNPMAPALNAVQAPGFEHYDLIPRAWWTSAAIATTLLVVLYLRIRQLCRAD